MSLISDVRMYWHFVSGLRGFIRNPPTLEQSKELVKRRIAEREKNFLAILKRTIYDNEKSPYLKLLNLAGCEFGDIESLANREGIESTLRKMLAEGVYLSWEEFKGKKEIIRDGRVFHFKDSDFDNPFLSSVIEARSGASRSAGTRTLLDFTCLREQWAVHHLLTRDANNVLGLPFAVWTSIVPGVVSTPMLLSYAMGIPYAKCFSRSVNTLVRPPLKSRLAVAYLVHGGRIFGARWPKPEYVAPDDAWKIAQWITQTLKEQGGCCMFSFPSSVVRVCQAARENGLDIRGAKFFLSGEPLTAAKTKEIESAGATFFTNYAFMEGGTVGGGCPTPLAPDDVHLFKDSFAIIQHERGVPHAEVSVNAFLITSLSPSASKILLNVEIGDYGIMESRHCGCKLDELGLTDHIYNIRGFDKLTGEGVTLIGTEVIDIIERILPAKFGGTSVDYQILEEEDEKASTRLSIVISPEVGAIDEKELVATVLNELGKKAYFYRGQAEIWSQAKTLQVKRMRPFITQRGKLLPLHIQKCK